MQDKTRQDKTRQDKTRQDKTRQDKTRQDKTRHDKTRSICGLDRGYKQGCLTTLTLAQFMTSYPFSLPKTLRHTIYK